MRTVGSQDRALYKLEYWDLEKLRDSHTKGGKFKIMVKAGKEPHRSHNQEPRPS